MRPRMHNKEFWAEDGGVAYDEIVVMPWTSKSYYFACLNGRAFTSGPNVWGNISVDGLREAFWKFDKADLIKLMEEP